MSWWFCESLVSLQWIQTNPKNLIFSACLDDFDGFPQCKQTVFPSCEVVNMLLKSQLLITISLWLDCGWRNPHPSDHPLTCLEPPMWTYHEHVIRSGDILPIKISDRGTSRQPPSHPVLVQGFASAPARKQLSTCSSTVHDVLILASCKGHTNHKFWQRNLQFTSAQTYGSRLLSTTCSLAKHDSYKGVPRVCVWSANKLNHTPRCWSCFPSCTKTENLTANVTAGLKWAPETDAKE